MKKIVYLLAIAAIMIICRACGLFGTQYTSVMWYLALRSHDTLLVTYPCNVPSYLPDEAIRFDTMRVCGDTVISYETATNGGGNYVNLYSISTRETFHDDVEIVFIDRSSWHFNYFHVKEWEECRHSQYTTNLNDTAFWEPIFRKHAVTLPKGQKSIMVHLSDCDCNDKP